jgi:hypothetical protein
MGRDRLISRDESSSDPYASSTVVARSKFVRFVLSRAMQDIRVLLNGVVPVHSRRTLREGCDVLVLMERQRR